MFTDRQKKFSPDAKLIGAIKWHLKVLKCLLVALVVALVGLGIEVAIVVSITPEQGRVLMSPFYYVLTMLSSALWSRAMLAFSKWLGEVRRNIVADGPFQGRIPGISFRFAGVACCLTFVVCLAVAYDAPAWLPAWPMNCLLLTMVLTGVGVVIRIKVLSHKLYLHHFSQEERAVIRARKSLDRLAILVVLIAALPPIYGLETLLVSLIQQPPLMSFLAMLTIIDVTALICYTWFYRPSSEAITQAYLSLRGEAADVREMSTLGTLKSWGKRAAVLLSVHVVVVGCTLVFLPAQPWLSPLLSILPLVIADYLLLRRIHNLQQAR